jgi:hypothetical protein
MTAKQTKANQANKDKQLRKRPVRPPKEGQLAQLEEQDLLALQRAVANPDLASPPDLLALQRTVGNRALQRVLAQGQGGDGGFDLEEQTAGGMIRTRGGAQQLDAEEQTNRREMGKKESGTTKRQTRRLERRTSGDTWTADVQMHDDPEPEELKKFVGTPQFLTVDEGKVGSIYRDQGRVRLQHHRGPQISDGKRVIERVSFEKRFKGACEDVWKAGEWQGDKKTNAEAVVEKTLTSDAAHRPPVQGEYLVEKLNQYSRWKYSDVKQKVHVSRGKVETRILLDEGQLDVIYDTVFHHKGNNKAFTEHCKGKIPDKYINEKYG